MKMSSAGMLESPVIKDFSEHLYPRYWNEMNEYMVLFYMDAATSKLHPKRTHSLRGMIGLHQSTHDINEIPEDFHATSDGFPEQGPNLQQYPLRCFPHQWRYRKGKGYPLLHGPPQWYGGYSPNDNRR